MHRLALQWVPEAERCHLWNAPNCASISVWRRETVRLGQEPSGTDLLTCCHLLLRYHHLVTLSNKTSNCGPFEARLCTLDSLFTLRGLQPDLVAGPSPCHPSARPPGSHSWLQAHRGALLPSLPPFSPLSQLHISEITVFTPKLAAWPDEAFLPQRCLKKGWLFRLECKLPSKAVPPLPSLRSVVQAAEL